jgi:hypothetical protein
MSNEPVNAADAAINSLFDIDLNHVFLHYKVLTQHGRQI